MVRRAWNGFVTEGKSKDDFANTVAGRVREEVEPHPGVSVQLVANWLEIADRMFDAGEDAETCDIANLYECIVADDDGDE
jgi:hypothetical protein